MTKRIVRSRSGRAAAGFVLVLALFVSGVATDRARAAVSKPVEQMLTITNETRADRGRDTLDLNARLSRYAERHSRAMAEAGTLFHSQDLAGLLNGLNWSIGGENVGVGTSLLELQDAFMASKPHRRNILRRGFAHTAIGVVKSDGRLWVTVIFYG